MTKICFVIILSQANLSHQTYLNILSLIYSQTPTKNEQELWHLLFIILNQGNLSRFIADIMTWPRLFLIYLIINVIIPKPQ